MHRKNPMWIGGDFNLPDIDWEVQSTITSIRNN